jgi:hypothetical protein
MSNRYVSVCKMLCLFFEYRTLRENLSTIDHESFMFVITFIIPSIGLRGESGLIIVLFFYVT